MFSAFSILFLNMGAAIIYYMSEDLLAKREKDENFRNQTIKNDDRYSTLQQASEYSQTPSVPEGILKKLSSDKQVYFYFGYLQPTLKKQMTQVALYLVKHFHPKTQQPYTIVFFNQKCSDNYVLWNFRETFCYLKLEQIAAIQQFIVVKPYFYHKTMDWMTFGTIPKFIRSKTKFMSSCKQLCDHLKLDLNTFVDQVPPVLYQKQFADLHARNTSLQILRMNIKGQERSEEENNTMLQFQKTIKSMIMKPGYEINNLEDYEIDVVGVPTILKMLVFYFDSHQQGLELEGIFRKSVSIDEENQTILQILSKNYDYLLDVENPHIIANLIKRFFSSLKNPAFTFEQFHRLMNDQGVKDKVHHLKEAFEALPELNKRTLLFIFTFLKEKILKFEHYNKMSAQNIAICFAPCIFRSEVASVADLIYATKGVMYCKLLLDEYEKIFGPKEERQVLYRKSYLQSKKTFENELDLGLEMAIEIASQNLIDVKSSRRISSNYNNQQLAFANIQLEEQGNKKIEGVDPELKKQEVVQEKEQQKQEQRVYKIEGRIFETEQFMVCDPDNQLQKGDSHGEFENFDQVVDFKNEEVENGQNL